MTAVPTPAPPAAAPPAPSLPPPPPTSAVDVFRTRQTSRRAVVVVFYRGERSRFCRTWLRRWLSVPALARRLRLADTALLFVSSQSQGKAYSVAAQSGVPEHLLDRLIYFLGDPAHGLAAHLERARLLAPVVTNPTGHRAHAWVYPNGMVQPAVVAAAADGRPLFAWAMQPSFRNAGGKLERPDPWDAWDYIEQKLDRARAGAIEPVPTPVPATVAMPLTTVRGAGATARVAAAAADAAEAAAREGAPSADAPPPPAIAPDAAKESIPPAPPLPKESTFPLAPAFPDVPDNLESHALPAADLRAPEEAFPSAEGLPSLEDAVASGSGSSEPYAPALPHVRSSLSDLAASAMGSNDASLSSIEAGKARVQFSLADTVVIEPRAGRDSLRSDGTGPKTPDISLLQAGPGQFDDASPVSARSAGVVAAEMARKGADDRQEMLPRAPTGLERVSTPGSDGPDSGRELIVDEFEVDEYVDELDDIAELEPVAVVAPVVEAASAQKETKSAPIEDNSVSASRNTVRNLIEKWAQLDAAQFGNVNPDAPPAVRPEEPANAVENQSAIEGSTVPDASYVAPKSVESVEAMMIDSGAPSPSVSVPECGEDEVEAAPTPPEEVPENVEGNVMSSSSLEKANEMKEDRVLDEKTMESASGDEAVVPTADEDSDEGAIVKETVTEGATSGTASEKDGDVDVASDAVEAVEAPLMSGDDDDDHVAEAGASVKENVPADGNVQRYEAEMKQEAVLDVEKDDEKRLKQLEKKAKKVEFLVASKDDEEGETKTQTSGATDAASPARKLSANMSPAERQGGWFSQNILSRLSKGSSEQPSFLQRRNMEQSPDFLRVPVSEDLAHDDGVLAIQRARDESAEAEAKAGPKAGKDKEEGDLEEIPLQDDRATDAGGPAARAKKIFSGVRVRSLPRNMSADAAAAVAKKGEEGQDDDEGAKLGRKLSLFSGSLKRAEQGAGPSRPRRHPFARAGARSGGVSPPDDEVAEGVDRRTAGLGRSSRKGREEDDADEATVRRKISLAKIGDAMMSKISVSYNPAAREENAAGPDVRRSSLRFARGNGNDTADLRRANTNVGGPSVGAGAREAQTQQTQNSAGFGRRLWSRWAKTKS